METIPLRGCTLILGRREVLRGGQVHVLSTLEADLLAWLLRHVDEPVSRETLLVEVWGFPRPIPTRAVDNTVMRLRTKIEVDPTQPDHLLTLRGVGYRLVLPPEVEPTQPLPLRMPPASVSADFLGRESALIALEQALASSRLVTVLGPGGCGKTRLVQEWSRERQGRVVCCDLAPAEQDADVLEQLARGVGASVTSSAAIRAALESPAAAAADAAAATVLILDNVESVAPAVAVWLSDTLAALPHLRVVCTSRERLHLRMEHLLELGPLAPPAAQALLRQRLQLLGAPIPEGGAALLAMVAEQLGGLPLAIELAAARCRVLSLSRLQAALAEGLGVLVSRERDRPARHQTMEAVIRWSWERLTPVHQDLLLGLSLLPGGIDLDTLETTLDTGEQLPQDLLEELRDRSFLLAAEGFEGDARFGLLEVIRRFVGARLDEHPHRLAIEDRLLDGFVVQSGRWRRAVHGLRPEEGIRRLRCERTNLLSLARRAQHRRPADCAQIIFNLGWHLLNESADIESLRMGVRAADAAAEPRLQVENRLLLGRKMEWTGQTDDAEQIHRMAMEMARAQDPARCAIAAFHLAAHHARRRDLPGVEALCQEGLAAAARQGQPELTAMLHNRLGSTLQQHGAVAAAIPVLEQAARGYRQTHQTAAIPYPLLGLAACWLATGQLSAAEAAIDEVLAAAEQLGILRLTAIARQEQGWLRLQQRRPAALAPLLQASAAARQTLADPALEAIATLQAAAAAVAQRQAVDDGALTQARIHLLRGDHRRWAAVASLLMAWEGGALLAAARREAEGLSDPDLLSLADWVEHSVRAEQGDPAPLRRSLTLTTDRVGALWHLGQALAAERWTRRARLHPG